MLNRISLWTTLLLFFSLKYCSINKSFALIKFTYNSTRTFRNVKDTPSCMQLTF